MDWDVMIQAILVAESLRKSDWCAGTKFPCCSVASLLSFFLACGIPVVPVFL